MWSYCAYIICGASLILAAPQDNSSSKSVATANSAVAPDTTLSSFLNICEGKPTASVSCGALASEEHAKEVEVRVIYWLTTRLPYYKETIQYDVVQHESTVSTTATRTISNNAPSLDMQSYTNLIPSAQADPSGPYRISEVDAVYGTTQRIGTATLTYPTPYALIISRVHVHQMGMCENGTEFTTSAWFNQPAPIPLPTTLNYQDMKAEVNFTIPGFNEAFHSLYPDLSYCTFTAFSGQPSPKVVVETSVTTDIKTRSAVLQSSSSTTAASAAAETTKTTTGSPAAAASSTSTNAAALSSAVSQLNSLASYIVCGLGGGGTCASSNLSSMTAISGSGGGGGVTDSRGQTYFIATPTASGAPTVATLGQGNVPIYTVGDDGAVAVPVWTTLEPGAPAATVGGAVVSVATDGKVVVVDGSTLTVGEAEQTGIGNVSGKNTWSGNGGWGGTGGGGYNGGGGWRSFGTLAVDPRGTGSLLAGCLLVTSLLFALAYG